MFPRFQKYLNAQVKTNKLVNIVFLPPLSFKISLKDTSFHISLNSLGFFLSEMLVEFSDFCIPTCTVKLFQFVVFTLLENALNLLCIFTHAPIPHSKFQVEFFENLFPKDGRGGGSYDLLHQNSIRKYEDNLEH